VGACRIFDANILLTSSAAPSPARHGACKKNRKRRAARPLPLCGRGYFLSALCFILVAIPHFAFAQAPAVAPDSSANALVIEVDGLRNDNGQVGCSLFNDPAAFPRDGDKVLKHIWAPIHNGKALCTFTGLAPGAYAAVVYHDENKNGQFDTNFLGMPKEGFGFTRDAPARFSPPTFNDASIQYTGAALHTVVNIRYWPL
jgi:uncharacterized protein (DUF2141 family)